jgi:hypothetical protein
MTCTPTDTVAGPPPTATYTPSTFVDFNDFDETGPWSNPIPNYVFSTQNNNGPSGSAASVDNVTYCPGTPLCSTGTASQSAAVTVANFGSGVAPNEGTVSAVIECDQPNCESIYEGPCGTLPGNNFSVMLYGSAGVSVTSVILQDNSGNEVCATPVNYVIPNGSWGNLVIPMSSFSPASGGPCPSCGGTVAGVEADGPYAVYINIAGPTSGSGKVNIDNIIFY